MESVKSEELPSGLSLLQKLLFLVADAFAFLLIYFLLYSLRVQQSSQEAFYASEGAWFVLAILLSSSYVLGAYDLGEPRPWIKLLKRYSAILLVSLVTVIIFHYLGAKSRAGLFGRSVLVGSLFVYCGFAILLRGWLSQRIFRRVWRRPWIFICSDNFKPELQADLKGFINLSLSEVVSDKLSEAELNSKVSKLASLVIAIRPEHLHESLSRWLMQRRLEGIRVFDLVDFYELNFFKIPIYYLSQTWFGLTRGFRLLTGGTSVRSKRLLDLIFAVILLCLLWPLMLLLALMIKLESRGPAIYRQLRTGKDGRNFWLFKFRSMRADAEREGPQWAQKNDQRVTRLGRWLRKTRLDELPQLINIVRGEMSFIGPRPERPEFNENLEKQISFYNIRHAVRPGLTGWAQVCYPYGASIEDARQKLQYDLFYIKNYSVFLDALILLKTTRVVLLSRGR